MLVEDATKALAYGPNGAAYGISQASPTGGINAVWVMPEEADPQALAQLATQQGGRFIHILTYIYVDLYLYISLCIYL